MIDISQEDNSGDQKLNGDEVIGFDDGIDGISDELYGIKLISMAGDTSLYIW